MSQLTHTPPATFQEELQRVMQMVLFGECICSESDRARAAFQCPVHREEQPL